MSRRGLLIVMWIQLLVQRCGDLRKQAGRDGGIDKFSCCSCQHRTITDREESKTKVLEDAGRNHGLCRQTGNGVIAMAAGKLMKEMEGVPLRYRHLDSDQQLLCRQRSLKNALEEIGRVNSPLAALASDHHRRPKGKHAGRQLGSGVGMREASANRPAVADGRMCNMPDGLRQERRDGVVEGGEHGITVDGVRGVAGEFLTGAVGQLPARDFVAVMVPDAATEAAGSIVRAIDRQLVEARASVAADDDLDDSVILPA